MYNYCIYMAYPICMVVYQWTKRVLSNISQVYPWIIHGIYKCYPIYMEVYPWFIPGVYTRYTNVFRLYHVYLMYIHMISNVYVAGFRSSWREGGWEEVEAQAAMSWMHGDWFRWAQAAMTCRMSWDFLTSRISTSGVYLSWTTFCKSTWCLTETAALCILSGA